MKFRETEIPGAFLVTLERREDHRGYFARAFCRAEFEANGLDPHIAQVNTGLTLKAGTVRGIHFQTEPHRDNKFVRCFRGAVFDVCVDLRRESPAFRKSIGVELTEQNGTMLYLPEGCGHGYQALTDNAEIMYTTNTAYAPDCAQGVRYDDPAFAIDWPMDVIEISDADQGWPDFEF